MELIQTRENMLSNTNGKTKKFYAMTMIDPATGWFEIAEIGTPSSDACQIAFDAY